MIKEQRKEAPAYLQDQRKFQKVVEESYELTNPEIAKKDSRNLKQLEDKKKKEPIAKKTALVEHERRLANFDRFDEDFVATYIAE